MKLLVTHMLVAFALTAAASMAAEKPALAGKPNILVILSDDQGYADVGFQGSKEIPTPHLDQLAHDGLRCTNGYVSHPYCSPSRAGLLTGRCQMRFGHERNPFFDPRNHREGLPTTETLLPQYLVKAGYATGWVGKWHLGAAPEFYPENRGFQETFGFLGGGHHYRDWKVNPEVEYNIPIRRNGKPVDVKEHLTLAFGHEAAAFVTRHKEGKPWFLYLAFNAPHTPHQPTAERLARFKHIKDPQRRAYLAQISLMDDAIGETLAAVRKTGQADRTLVFFFGDNGGPTYVGPNNAPLRGSKGTTYEGGVRVPFLVSWPSRLPKGKDYEGIVSSLDVFATALACAGVPMPTDKPHDGVNLIPFLSGQKGGSPHDRLFWREEELGQWGERDGSMKLVRRTRDAGVKKGRWMTKPLAQPSHELYDLAQDVGESTNLAAAQPEKLRAMDAALDAWQKQAAPLAFSGIKGKEREPMPRNQSSRPKPTPVQLAWQELDFGVLICLEPRVYNGDGEYANAAKVFANPHVYAEKFKPAKLDTDQWVATAKSLGANHAILLVKQDTGFCLWQSKANPYSLKSISWRDGKADILREFVASCKKYGITPGIFTEARWDKRLGIADFKVNAKAVVSQAAYDRLLEQELEELCTGYGELCEVWYDAGAGPASARLAAIAAKCQPGMAFYTGPDPEIRSDYRWGGFETGIVNYPCWSTINRNQPMSNQLRASGDPDGRDWFPARADVPLRCEHRIHHWYWHPGGEKGVASLERLKQIYYGSVGRNAKVVIGFTPNRDGLMDAADVARCKEFGDWLTKTFGGKPLAATSGTGTELTLELPTDAKGPATHVVLQEEIKDGEHVCQYVVEAKQGDLWKTVCTGSCIGHKRIEQIPPCDARAFRLRILETAGPAAIRSFSVR